MMSTRQIHENLKFLSCVLNFTPNLKLEKYTKLVLLKYLPRLPVFTGVDNFAGKTKRTLVNGEPKMPLFNLIAKKNDNFSTIYKR